MVLHTSSRGQEEDVDDEIFGDDDDLAGCCEMLT